MFPEVVDLNVGGVYYAASLATLTKIPGSYLAEVFTGQKEVAQDAHGRYFIDRDGVLFRYVLDYLRNGEVRLPENFQENERLRREAHFYGFGDILIAFLSLDTASNGDIAGSKMDLYHKPLTPTSNPVSVGRPFDSNSGVVTVGYRGTFAFGREGTAEVKFRKLTRILVCGRVSLCRSVFGETLNESRDPDRGSDDRYTSRFFLKHSFLEQAFDMLVEGGFRLVGCCGTGTSSSGAGLGEQCITPTQKPSITDGEESRWNHYNEFVWQKL